jgi:hypothetical protein
MGILLAFAPFIGFAVVDRLLGSTEGLFVGFAISAALLLRDWLSPNRSPKVLEIGTAILFGGLALYALLTHPGWSIMGVRLAVDSGLLLIVMTSIAIRQPFTLQYAREQVPQGGGRRRNSSAPITSSPRSGRWPLSPWSSPTSCWSTYRNYRPASGSL